MKLATRLTVLLVVITTIVALSVGWYAVNSSTHSAYATIDNTINSVVQSGEGNPDAALSDAINADEKNNYDLTLDVVFANGSVTQLISANTALDRTPSLSNVHSSLKSVVSEANLPGFLIRSLNIGGGDYLVVAASTKSVKHASQQLIFRVALAALAAAIVMVVVARLFMRRDLVTMEGLIDFASNVASGNAHEPVPPGLGSRDVRELRQALATMVVALQEKIEIESRHAESMQMFIGDASHELRTPLTVLKGYTELISNADVSADQLDRALGRMRKEIERMETLVTDLLLIAEVRELPEKSMEPLELSLLVSSCADEFHDDQAARRLDVTIDPNVWVRGRRDLFERLMTNALGNIARHTKPDVAVRIALQRREGSVELRIDDAGEGLPEYGAAPERFRRFDSSRSRESGGSGLGMSIMFDLAKAMNGSMTTSASELGGLRLTFLFPAAN